MTERRCAWMIAFAVAALAVTTRVLPYDWRPFNLTAIGALALFTASRLGLTLSFSFTVAAMLVSDLILFILHHMDLQYAPSWAVYCSLLAYSLIAWQFLRSSLHPIRIAAVATGAGLFFFLTTNFAVWLGSQHTYAQTWDGLIGCYSAALPFYRGILFGDLAFSAAAFGAYALVVRSSSKLSPVTVPAQSSSPGASLHFDKRL